MAVDHHDVFPAVVVDIEKAVAPADERDGRLRDAGLVGDIGKAGFAVIVVQRL